MEKNEEFWKKIICPCCFERVSKKSNPFHLNINNSINYFCSYKCYRAYTYQVAISIDKPLPLSAEVWANKINREKQLEIYLEQ